MGLLVKAGKDGSKRPKAGQSVSRRVKEGHGATLAGLREPRIAKEGHGDPLASHGGFLVALNRSRSVMEMTWRVMAASGRPKAVKSDGRRFMEASWWP